MGNIPRDRSLKKCVSPSAKCYTTNRPIKIGWVVVSPLKARRDMLQTADTPAEMCPRDRSARQLGRAMFYS